MKDSVESRCGAVVVGSVCLLPPLSFGGAQVTSPSLRFHIPLIEPDMQIARIRLSDKTSRLRPRRAAPTLGQTYEPEVPVEVREWIRPLAPLRRALLDTLSVVEDGHARPGMVRYARRYR